MSDKEIGTQLENAAVKIVIAFAAIVVLGTAVIPVVLSCLYTWEWLLCYPVCLIAFVIYAIAVTKKASKRKNSKCS